MHNHINRHDVLSTKGIGHVPIKYGYPTSMGTLIFESVIFIYGWAIAHMALVTEVSIFLVNIT